MKEITKLRLVNWHLFANDTVDIKNITFLTGSNGTGKSTIIDAMQIVLLGDTSGRNFNKAANDRTGRTLRGYLRCETGETAAGQVLCLRPGRFTTYVALQLHDTSADKDITLGIVFDAYEDDHEEHRFFFLDDKFPDNNFTNRDQLDSAQPRPLSSKELAQFFANNYGPNKYQFFDTNVSYQNFIKHALGDLPDKYFTLFKKAVSFSPITNISNFITEFVCDIDYNIDISSMQTNIEQYKLLELEAKKLQVKINALTEIKTAFANYNKAKEDLGLADYLTYRANYETSKLELENYNNKLSENKKRINDISDLLIEKDRQISELKAESESYLAKKVGSAGYSLSATISQKKQQAIQKITTLEQNYASLGLTLKSYIKQYNDVLKAVDARLTNLNTSFLSEQENDELEKFIDLEREFGSTASDLLQFIDTKNIDSDLLFEFQSEMASLHSQAIKLNHLLDNSIYTISSTRSSLDKELDEIHSGHKPFATQYMQVKAALQSSLQERYSAAQVSSYCDLVDINDKRWSKAIEAYIFSQKFNFFVEDRYYEDAAKLLAKICKDYGYYSVSVVDTRKLIERGFEADEGSVAEEISTTHSGAQAYTNFLLGRVKKCETFAEARQSGNGLLANCTGYRNFASFYLNEKRGEVSFLGTKVDQSTALNKQNDFAEISKNYDLYVDLNSYIKDICSLEVLSTSETKTFVSDILALNEIDSLNKEVERLESEMKEGELNQVSVFDEKIRAIDVDIASLEEEKKNLLIEQGGLVNSNKNISEELIPVKAQTVSTYGDRLLKFDPSIVESTYAPFFENALENIPLNKIKSDASLRYVQIQNRVKNTKDKLVDLRTKYTISYHLGYDNTKEENNNEFDEELDNLSNVMLPSYLSQIEVAHKKAIKEFKDDFIYKLRTSFETISTQIDELNLALKEIKFGRDSYRFSIEPNKDFIEYYNMITDDLLLNVGDAEDIYLEKYGPVMTNLFNMISDSTDANADQKAQIIENVKKFTDYRTYLIFDLLVKRGENATESSLARSFKRQSGGETQTPFYISILASFAQLYRTNDENSDTLRLVIFDEAFSKMDGTRIKEAVGLLRSFGLQAILSTPTEKVTDLVNEVDLTLVAMHDAKRNRSRIDRYQDRRKLSN